MTVSSLVVKNTFILILIFYLCKTCESRLGLYTKFMQLLVVLNMFIVTHLFHFSIMALSLDSILSPLWGLSSLTLLFLLLVIRRDKLLIFILIFPRSHPYCRHLLLPTPSSQGSFCQMSYSRFSTI